MNQLSALAWKEWREVRWVVGFSLVVFVGLPLAFAVENRQSARGMDFDPLPLVMLLGGFMAMVAAAMSVCRDLQGRLGQLWRSFPIRVPRWMLVKYTVGLTVVSAACLAPMLIAALTQRGKIESDPAAAAALLVAVVIVGWGAQYGLGFVCACLVRRTGPAIMLALALSLLIHFLPLFLPPLSRSPWLQGDLDWRVTSLALVAIASPFLGVAAVRWDWRLSVGRGVMYGSIAGVFLLFFASAAFMVASNLPMLQEVDLGQSKSILYLQCDGRRGMVLIGKYDARREIYLPDEIRSLEVTPAGVRLGPAMPPPKWGGMAQGAWPIVWLPNHPELFFSLRWVPPRAPHHPFQVELITGSVDPGGATPAAPLELGVDVDPDDPNSPQYGPGQWPLGSLCAAGDRLCATWSGASGLAIVDVGDPKHPRLLKAAPFSFTPTWSDPSATPDLLFPLPRISDLSPRDRLTVLANACLGGMLDRDLYVSESAGGLAIYRLKRLSSTDDSTPPAGAPKETDFSGGYAEFHLIGIYHPTFIEQLIGSDTQQVALNRRFAYVSGLDGAYGRSARITVYGLNDPATPRPVGHFAIGAGVPLILCPLPDGGVLAGGRKLYLLGPPPRN